MNMLTEILAAVAAGTDPGPFALIRREDAEEIDVLTGSVTVVERLADIPLPSGPPGPKTLALVPFRQVTERGFAAHDDGAPLECLRVERSATVVASEVVAALPEGSVGIRSVEGFDVSDDDYADLVERIVRDEIGRGEGANFVIQRTFRASVEGGPLAAAMLAFRRLLLTGKGAYWTFVVYTGERILLGATPERHVSVTDRMVMMNPISGTLRHPDGLPSASEVIEFLGDRKETDELYMVLDEELKMMAEVAEAGGRVVGPYLKPMSHLTHTEYLLAGTTDLDVRDVLRHTMFAPTVTGSPLENACRVIERHERNGRGYYAGVLALLGRDSQGEQTLDAPILIRAAEISPDGTVRVSVGATLVRHSTPQGEVAETHAKAAGVLTALGLRPASPVTHPSEDRAAVFDSPEVQRALADRNVNLARFWLDDRRSVPVRRPFAGRRALIVDGEDTFTSMLAHQLRSLGLRVTVTPWQRAGHDLDSFDLVVCGPGPGDPTSTDDPKIAALRGFLGRLLAERRPTLAVCLSHQLLSGMLGLPLRRRDSPYQGMQRDVDLFGQTRRLGFYSTYTATAENDGGTTPYGEVTFARDARDGSLHAMKGPDFAGIQFHPESVLSRDGMAVLEDLLDDLLRVRNPLPMEGS
ncbi:anthranilate synthase family protein [Micromonospora musae]|uniref:anthranilate synthase family protein n=1 Tax=Micromonospora musae TaxID=1894970 RepID=UPI0033C2AB53